MVEGPADRVYRGEKNPESQRTAQEAVNAAMSVGAGIPSGDEYEPGVPYDRGLERSAEALQHFSFGDGELE
jgi:hypothetical protein